MACEEDAEAIMCSERQYYVLVYSERIPHNSKEANIHRRNKMK